MPDLSRDLAPAPERPLDALLDAAATLTAVVTVEGRLLHWNDACRRLAGTSAPEARLDAIPEGEHLAAREALARVAHGESPVHADDSGLMVVPILPPPQSPPQSTPAQPEPQPVVGVAPSPQLEDPATPPPSPPLPDAPPPSSERGPRE